ncbi:hypothetical protein COV18_02085 [Candidatus Woesearchaeota archaeon CG10_big_fil_rev_8_21_14_0_10_37_12]|nr:MAG: hypothetical protein COV18_02085 [Candidatus Woesearchaeota archaeon CG10_big_fil_rev_8_21_14_0_10_37_12]
MVKSTIGNAYVFDAAFISLTDLVVSHTPYMLRVQDNLIGASDKERNITETIKEFSLKPGEYDGTLLYLTGLDLKGRHFLSTNDTKYIDYQAVRAALNGEGSHVLTRVLNLVALVETTDNKLVFGHKTTAHMGGLYSPPAGFSDHDNPVPADYFARLTVEEISEETGVSVDKKSLMYVGLTSGDDSRNITVVTYARVNETAEGLETAFTELNRKLIEAGDRVEHDHLLYVPSDPDSVREFLANRYTGVLNSWQGIHFENGVCTAGPEDIKRQEYGQIGNCVAAVLALMKQRCDDKTYANMVNEIKIAGVVDDVVHVNLEDML